MLLPGTSPGNVRDFTINIVYQMIAFYVGILKYTYFDILFLFQMLHIILLTNIMRSKIGAVSDMASMKQVGSNIFKIDINMRNVVMVHMEILKWVYFTWSYYLQIAANDI